MYSIYVSACICCGFLGVAAALLQVVIASTNQLAERSGKLFDEWAIKLWGGNSALYFECGVSLFFHKLSINFHNFCSFACTIFTL